MMIPRSQVKHQYKPIGLGTKGDSGGPAVFMFPVKGAHLVQLQPSSTAEQRLCFGRVRHGVRKRWELCKCPCLKEPVVLQTG